MKMKQLEMKIGCHCVKAQANAGLHVSAGEVGPYQVIGLPIILDIAERKFAFLLTFNKHELSL